jgi:hypothetical protein
LLCQSLCSLFSVHAAPPAIATTLAGCSTVINCAMRVE